ncbi:MAG: ATP phosphoribosyltransferase [Oceanipulchritudo sp.]
MDLFKVAIPNKGSLSEGAVKILADAGYLCRRHSRELVVRDAEHQVEFIFLRPRDIAVYVGSGVIHAGITGRDLALDSQAEVKERLSLGLGKSRFCYAVPAGSGLRREAFDGKRIATSYPNIVRADLAASGIEASVVRLDGAVEISIQLGVADAIADVVESGRTLVEAGLEITGEPVMKSEAVLIQRKGDVPGEEMDLLVRRLEGILVARAYVLLEYVAPKTVLKEACAITPGVKSPTLSPVSEPDWMAVAAMVRSKGLNRIIDQLNALGAKGIIAQEIRTCRL